jgi:hypothetical protein
MYSYAWANKECGGVVGRQKFHLLGLNFHKVFAHLSRKNTAKFLTPFHGHSFGRHESGSGDPAF